MTPTGIWYAYYYVDTRITRQMAHRTTAPWIMLLYCNYNINIHVSRFSRRCEQTKNDASMDR